MEDMACFALIDSFKIFLLEHGILASASEFLDKYSPLTHHGTISIASGTDVESLIVSDVQLHIVSDVEPHIVSDVEPHIVSTSYCG